MIKRRRRRRREGGRRRKVKEREGKEGRRLKWILFNVFKTMLIECNGRNVLFQVMEIIDLISLQILPYLLCFFTFFSPPPLGDGDYICAGSHRQHELYIWDKATDNLVKILTGPKGESLLDLTWHPVFWTALETLSQVTVQSHDHHMIIM